MLGYYKEPQLTREAFTDDGWLHTGDKGALDAEGIYVSAGAACHSGKVEPSATMKAMGKPANQAIGTVRFSLSRYTSGEEIDRTIEIVRAIAENRPAVPTG